MTELKQVMERYLSALTDAPEPLMALDELMETLKPLITTENV